MRVRTLSTSSSRIAASAAVLFLLLTTAFAMSGPFSGAIFTTDPDYKVNGNIYSTQLRVYLNGGPHNKSSEGLPPNETFYYQVTDPNGDTLLSLDRAECRQVDTNAEGRVFGNSLSVPATCTSAHGEAPVNETNGSKPVLLFPFAQTPNNGGEYKVWLIRKSDPNVMVASDGKTILFPSSAAKTDNFKIKRWVPSGGVD